MCMWMCIGCALSIQRNVCVAFGSIFSVVQTHTHEQARTQHGSVHEAFVARCETECILAFHMLAQGTVGKKDEWISNMTSLHTDCSLWLARRPSDKRTSFFCWTTAWTARDSSNSADYCQCVYWMWHNNSAVPRSNNTQQQLLKQRVHAQPTFRNGEMPHKTLYSYNTPIHVQHSVHLADSAPLGSFDSHNANVFVCLFFVFCLHIEKLIREAFEWMDLTLLKHASLERAHCHGK